MTPLILSSPILAAIYRHARQGFPEEVCGILVGRDLADQRLVEQIIPASNLAPAADRANRFLLDSAALLEAQRNADSCGQSILGFYHSHPNGSRRPSKTDLESAWPVYSYVIAGITEGGEMHTAGWVLNAAGDQFESQPIKNIAP